MNNYPEILQFTLRNIVNDSVKWVETTFAPVTDIISTVLLRLLMLTESFLLWLPWWVFVLVIIYLGRRASGTWKTGIILGGMMMVIGSLGLWQLSMQTLAIVIGAVLVSLLLGIPIGILMTWNRTMESIVRPILDAMQTMPSFVYLIPAFFLFGLGKVPAVFATIIYAIPPIIRLTNLGLRQVPADMVEASYAFGSTRLQTLFKVQIPLAMPSIMSGVNQTTMMALAMVVIASMIGARGVGEQVLISIGRLDVGMGFEAGLSIVIMAIIFDRILQGFGNKQKTSTQR